MKHKRRVITLVLAIMMVVSVLAFPASATSGASWEGRFRNFRMTSRNNYIAGYASAAQSFLLGYEPTAQAVKSAGGVDGMFGAGTAQAVALFQRRSGLGDDGIVGPDTWGAMACAMSASSSGVPVTLSIGGRNVIRIRRINSTYNFFYYDNFENCVEPAFHLSN